MNSINLSSVIEKYIALQRKGSNIVALCPFHDEKTPSFTVNDDKGFFHCFGCGEHGSAFDFLTKMEGVSFKESVEMLAQMSGVALEYVDNNVGASGNYEHDKMHKIMDKVSNVWEENLSNNSKMLEYLQKRGIVADSIKKFRVGYAKSGAQICDFCKCHDLTSKQMIKYGLARENKFGNLSDYFNDRIIFPIFDLEGRIIAFGGRSIKNDKFIPKYLNSPENDLFKKGKILYGYNFAKSSARRKGEILVVEGYVDCIILQQSGFGNVVASMGTAISSDVLKKMWDVAENIIFCFDGDSAGYRAMMKVASVALSELSPKNLVRGCILPTGNDPADVIVSGGGANKFSELIGKSKNLAEVIYDDLMRGVNSEDVDQLCSAEYELLNLASKIKNFVVRKNYRDFFINKLRRENYKIKHSSDRNSVELSSNKINPGDNPYIATVVKILIKNPQVIMLPNIETDIMNFDIVDKRLDGIVRIILKLKNYCLHNDLELNEKYIMSYIEGRKSLCDYVKDFLEDFALSESVDVSELMRISIKRARLHDMHNRYKHSKDDNERDVIINEINHIRNLL